MTATQEKPLPKMYKCAGCNIEADKEMTGGWTWFNFKTLPPVWICRMCLPLVINDLVANQAMGL